MSDELIRGERSARIAVVVLFVELGFGFGSWAVRIPDVQHQLGLGEAALGVALLALAVGSLIGMPLAGVALARFDQRAAAACSGILFAVGLALPALAPDLVLLCLSLVVLGMGNGALGVAMNAQGASLEKILGRTLLSTCHGLFSVGALVGSLSSGVLAGAGVPAGAHLAVVAVVLAAAAGSAHRYLPRVAPSPGSPVFVRPNRAVAIFGVMAFAVLFCEGAVTDWSAVHLREELDAGPAAAGIGYTAFALAMASGRLLGDRLTEALGRVRLVRLAGAVATVGATTIVLAPAVAVGWLGFALLGAGASVVFPNVLAAAAEGARDKSSASAIAAVSSLGYLGFLLGPPFIGFVAEWGGLRLGLSVTIVCAAAVAALAGVLAAADRPTGADAR